MLRIVTISVFSMFVLLAPQSGAEGPSPGSEERPSRRGRPESFRLPEARSISADYVGADGSPRALDPSRTRPTGLAAGDFDEDGVPDLISGYATGNGGVLTMHRGNLDSIYPNNAGAQRRRAEGSFTDAPFLTPARVFDTPEAPDFLAVGDFDADGHQDVAFAARAGRRLLLFAGDGQGELTASQTIDLPGSVAAFAAGEINRRDGLTDLAVGIAGPTQRAVLIFEGSEGAISSEPVVVPVAAEPTALALGRFSGGMLRELVVATESGELLLVDGTAATADVIARVASPIHALAWGDFDWDAGDRRELAAMSEDGTLSLYRLEAGSSSWQRLASREVAVGNSDHETAATARSLLVAGYVSGVPMQELVVVDRVAGRLHLTLGEIGVNAGDGLDSHVSSVIPGGVAAVLPMRLNEDGLSDLVLLSPGSIVPAVATSSYSSTWTVNSTFDGQDFIPGDGQCITGTECSLRAAIEEANAHPNVPHVINFNIPGPGPHVINVGSGPTAPGQPLPPITRRLTINGYTQPGAASNSIPSPGPTDAVLKIVIRNWSTTGSSGLDIEASGTVVRGLVIREFGSGISVATGTSNVRAEGCYIGTDDTGTVDLGNSTGVVLHGPMNTIGGTAPSARNVISGSNSRAVLLGSTENVVQGNYIGTDATGGTALGNGGHGIQADFGGDTIAGNVISGNVGDGVRLHFSTATNTVVLDNHIGTDAAGGAALGNGDNGIMILSADNTIGGNVISANGAFGVRIDGAFSADGNVVRGNRIGTDLAGGVALGNTLSGVLVEDASSTLIGGPNPADGNVISGNLQHGVLVEGSPSDPSGTSGNLIVGNTIGTDAGGTVDLGNNFNGIELRDTVGNLVGGTLPGHGNLISGNDVAGVFVLGTATGNRVEGNRIGTDGSGTGSVPNSLSGVFVEDASSNQIGGTDFGAGNVIAGNDGPGVIVAETIPASTFDNQVLGNLIWNNAGVGIDLGDDGVTSNEGEVDGLQNFPDLASIQAAPTSTLIDGTLDTTAGSFRLEFFSSPVCDASNHGEGARFLGSANVATAGTGAEPFQVTLPVHIEVGEAVSATATDLTGSTSEFSACSAATSCPPFGETIRAAADGNSLFWDSPTDVRFAKGELATVGSYATTGGGPLSGATALDISGDNPGPGNGLWYLVRQEPCGSWQTALGAEPGRDAGGPLDPPPVCGDGVVDPGEQCDDGNSEDANGDTDNCMNDCTLPRFVNNGDGTVTDRHTSLIWLRDSSCAGIPDTDSSGYANWWVANGLDSGTETPTNPPTGVRALADGMCGLTDGSSPGDWRLPTLECPSDSDGSCSFATPSTGEFATIFGTACVTVPFSLDAPGTGCGSEGNPFTGLETSLYWSASPWSDPDFAFRASTNSGSVQASFKTADRRLWPVRGGLPPIAFCGNSILDSGEACDDGNSTNGDGCTVTCIVEFCGDSVVNNDGMEECDEGGETETCDIDCTIPSCGDGLTNVAAGEECDDGGNVDGDGCTAGCIVEPGFTIDSASPLTGTTECRGSGSEPGCSAWEFENAQNLASSANGALPAVALNVIPGHPDIHRAEFANDGFYGNGSSWIGTSSGSWVKIDLGQTVLVSSVRFGRDRTGGFNDRDPGDVTIQVATSDNVYANGDETNDGAEYVTVAGPTAITIDGDQTWKASFAPVSARYVKLIVSSAGAAIDEIEVEGP